MRQRIGEISIATAGPVRVVIRSPGPEAAIGRSSRGMSVRRRHPMLTLRFSHTHIYRGAVARTDAPLPDRGETPCLVEFADGVQVPARLTGGGDALCLSLEAYATAHGTGIPAKRWCLASRPGDGITLRVTSRAADPG